MDVMQGEPGLEKVAEPLHKELSQVAKELVAFDGFMERNQKRFMLRAIESAEAHANTAARLACGE
jgi:hypothetical protein